MVQSQPQKLKAPPRPRVKKTARSEEERQQKLQAILEAAFEVFSAHGFAAARLEDVAKRAGVGKGTLYLYAASKEDLFIAMIRNSFTTPFDVLEAAINAHPPRLEDLMALCLEWFQREVIGTRRREMLWLVLREAKQFPEIAKAHHEIVVSRVMALIRLCSERAVASGEIAHDEISRFPQLAMAVPLVSVIWLELFQKWEPLDVAAMLDAFRTLLLRGLKGDKA